MIKSDDTIQHKFTGILSDDRFSNRIAVERGNETMTYGELDEKSGRVAHWLLEQGIPKETFIGVLLENRVDFIVVLLGVLKAGCVFVPLDSSYPDERLKTMIHDTGLRFVVSDDHGSNKRLLPGDASGQSPGDVELVLLRQILESENPLSPAKTFEINYSPEDRIYIYFTSGTTGKPRAIVGKNKSLLHFINWEIDTFGIDETVRVSQFTNPTFDAYLRDIFVPLCSGGTICIQDDKDILSSGKDLIHWIHGSMIHLIHCVPSLFRTFSSNPLKADHFPHLKTILMSGEKIEPADLVHWYNTLGERVRLVNLWGTSETTLAKTFYMISKADVNRERVPVGKPIKGARVVVLDEKLELCRDRVVGHLYIRTPYRTYGYYNDPQLNKERFIPNPLTNNADDLLHKTGDLGRILPDGNIEVLGRSDRQVKIQGIRIELEEVECILAKHPSVREAVVIKKETLLHNPSLYAFLTASHGVDQDSLMPVLQEYLSKEVPMYMVPSYIIPLDDMPRTINGKVDYKALAEIKVEKAVHVEPANAVERKLLEQWHELLKLDRISTRDNFFAIGGNSLNIMNLISRIHREFDVRIPLGQILSNPTIIDQAGLIISAAEELYPSVEPSEKKEYYPLSSAQERMYIIQQMEPESFAYNLPFVFELGKTVHKETLDEIVLRLIERHGSFRTSFHMIDNHPVQKLHDDVQFELEYYEVHGDPGKGEKIIRDFVKPFDLTRAPLLRVGLLSVSESRLVVMMDMHHIISDWISINLLNRDFRKLLNGEALAPLDIQYKDYCQWQARPERIAAVQRQEKYWLKQFEEGAPLLNLPTDFPRQEIQSFEGGLLEFELDREKTAALKKIALDEGATSFMILLAVYNVLLFRLTGQEDIVVGSDISERKHHGLENIIGNFINTLALRNYPSQDKTFREFLVDLKKRTFGAFDNQDYQFEDLVKHLLVERDASRNPVFDVMFYFLEVDSPSGETSAREMPGLPAEDEHRFNYENSTAKFDLNLSATTSGGKFLFTLEYCSSLFKVETIKKFSRYFEEIVDAIIENTDIELKDISVSHNLLTAEVKMAQVDFGF